MNMDGGEPNTSRSFADSAAMARDTYAGILSWHWQGGEPGDGDVVELVKRGSIEPPITGVVTSLDSDGGLPRSYEVVCDDGHRIANLQEYTISTRKKNSGNPEVSLAVHEAFVIRELITELGSIYEKEPLGELASRVAETITRLARINP